MNEDAMNISTLNTKALRQALNLRDLTDPDDGRHAMQILIGDILVALRKTWGCEIKIHRQSPIITIEDNYNKLRYPPDGAARDARYTRYVTKNALLRTMASAMIPQAMISVADNLPEDVLLVCPGLVYRRDCIDRLHTGEPHQLDLWRVHRSQKMGKDDLVQMVGIIVGTALPGQKWRTEPRVHPYTLDGLQIDVMHNGEWVEIGECGLAHPEIIAENIPRVKDLSGLALGLGLDRLLMVRKNIRDIRLLRSTDPRVASQMLDLSPYREVSLMPPVTRDISLVLDEDATVEDIGDNVREALGQNADVVENVNILSQTLYDELPSGAIERLGMAPRQKNLLLRIVLRALDRTLTSEECNAYRDAIYAALHKGSAWQWASKGIQQ
jgi:phenylalanyl-tRNA synthetase alpha chain